MVAALNDDEHAAVQRARYAARRARLRPALESAGWEVQHSEAGLYLWAAHPAHDCWGSVHALAAAGILVAPGELYGAGRPPARPGRAHRHRRADRRRRIAAGGAGLRTGPERPGRSAPGGLTS